ncbi:MAG: hypothetical protein ACKVXR_00020 [Planctomycetota bacterium]
MLLASPVAAQNLNVDIGLNTVFPVPASTYGAAAAQPGVWNGVSGAVVGPVALSGLSGSPSGVNLSRAGSSGNFAHDNAGTLGEDDSLMDDCQDLGGAGSSSSWTFTGLANGAYQVFTYAWAPDDGTYRTNVSVAGSADPVQTLGGDWPGSHVLGTTYAVHNVTVTSGTIVVTATTADDPVFGFGSLNGIQIKGVLPPPSITPFCFGDGTSGACPCGNAGQTGKGCENSIATGGAHLTASGTPLLSADNVVLNVTGERPTSLTIFLQGMNSISPVTFGDGLRCFDGSLKRLYTKAASGGASSGPALGDPSISARSAALSDPIAPGATRYYNTYYRDGNPTFCPEPTGSAFNSSNGLTILWN